LQIFSSRIVRPAVNTGLPKAKNLSLFPLFVILRQHANRHTMKAIRRLLQRPKNSFYLGLLLGLLFLVSIIFPVIQTFSLIFLVELPLEFADCANCILVNLNIIFCISLIAWTFFCIYQVSKCKTYKPLRISLYMLIGYILTNNIIALTFEKEAMRSSDDLKYLFLYSTAPFASLTPIIYGLIFNIIATRQTKSL
jgi:hypothetical protein